jgi:hypothetical protein
MFSCSSIKKASCYLKGKTLQALISEEVILTLIVKDGEYIVKWVEEYSGWKKNLLPEYLQMIFD